MGTLCEVISAIRIRARVMEKSLFISRLQTLEANSRRDNPFSCKLKNINKNMHSLGLKMLVFMHFFSKRTRPENIPGHIEPFLSSTFALLPIGKLGTTMMIQ
jgi:hypothetical protein